MRSIHKKNLPVLLSFFILIPLLAGCATRTKFVGISLKPGKEVTLSGVIHKPDGEGPFPAVVLLHCTGRRVAILMRSYRPAWNITCRHSYRYMPTRESMLLSKRLALQPRSRNMRITVLSSRLTALETGWQAWQVGCF